jgi:hypothetical protein
MRSEDHPPARTDVANDERHLALPKLYGQPAYARPTVPVAAVARPFDPDDLPLEVAQTEDERDLVAQVQGRVWTSGLVGEAVGAAPGGGREGSPMLRGRPFRLGSVITSRFRGDGGPSAGA